MFAKKKSLKGSGFRKLFRNAGTPQKQQELPDLPLGSGDVAADYACREEKVLARGEHCSLLILNLILYVLVALLALPLVIDCFQSWLYWGDLYYFGELIAVILAAAALCFLVYLLTIWRQAHETLLITNKRVFYRFLFRRLDLPLDSISAAGTNLLYLFTVSTPSGVIRIPFLKNNQELHETLTKLLIARQTIPASSAPAVPIEEDEMDPLDIADEIPDLSDITDFPDPDAMIASEMEFEPEPVPEEEPLPEGYRIGRCVMCRRIELPVKTTTVVISGMERKRTLCEKCAEKYNVK